MNRVLLALAALLLAGGAQALRLEKPYTATVMVASQAEADRKTGVQEALLAVLERLSGQELAGTERGRNLVAGAEQALLEFAYRAQVIDDPAKTWPLEVSFSQPAIDQLLKNAGLPAWPLERPELLVVALDSASKQLLALPYRAGAAEAPWQRELRGLPLKQGDVAGYDPAVALALAEQNWSQAVQLLAGEDVDGYLFGVVDTEASPVVAKWQLFVGQQQQAFDSVGENAGQSFEHVLGKVIAHLSSAYADSNAQAQQLELLKLQIDGVTSYPAFMNVQAYLEGLEVVESIQSSQILGTSVIVDVKVKGRDNFRQLMELSRQLVWQDEMLPPEGSDPSMRPVWRYLWQDK